MPKIPAYQRQQSITGKAPAVTAHPSVFQGGAKALGHLAEFADTLAVEKERLEKEERHYSTLRLGNEVNEVALNFEQERLSLTGTDAYNSMEAVDKWAKETRDKFVTGLKDQQVSRDIEQHIASQALKLKSGLAKYEARQRDLVAEDTRVKTLESATKAAYQGSGTLEDNLQVYNTAIVNDPRLRDSDKENKLMAGQSAIAAARLDGMIDRNPAAALEFIESGMFNEYLDADQLEHFQNEANKVKKGFESLAKAKEKEAKEAKEAQQLETGHEFFNALIRGELTPSMIARSNLEPTGQNSKQSWYSKIDKAGKSKSVSPEEQEALESELTAMILEDPESVTNDVILDFQNRGLPGTKTRTLTNFRDKHKNDPLKSEQAKAAFGILKAAKSADMFDSSDEVENVKRYNEATRLTRKFIENNPDKDPQEFVDQILEEPKNGMLRKVFDFLPFIDDAEASETRQERLEAEAGIQNEKDKADDPSAFDNWLKRARKMPSNDQYSDEELRAYYERKHANS